jgi:hypothetical protein
MARFTGIIGKSLRDQPVLIEAHQLWRCVVFPPSAPALLLPAFLLLLRFRFYSRREFIDNFVEAKASEPLRVVGGCA